MRQRGRDEGMIEREAYIEAQGFAQRMQAQVEPYLLARRTEGYADAADGKKLYYALYRADAPRGTLTIVHGFTENAEKYREWIYYALLDGLNVLIYEARGHGRSHRTLADKTLTHVRRFEDYVRDLVAMERVASTLPPPHYLYAHSMGGAVAALYLEQGGALYKKAVLSSPMIAPHRGGLPLLLAKGMCRAAILLGKGATRIFVSKPYAGREDFEQSCSSCRERFCYFEQIKRECEDFHNACPTYGWTLESLKVTKKLLKKGAVERIAIPVRLYAAALDRTVLLPEQRRFAARLPQGEYVLVPNTDHEICLSQDDVAFDYFSGMLEFFR